MNAHTANEPTACPRLTDFDSSDWKQIERLFGSVPLWKFSQAWRDKRERGFRGGKVRIGWRGDRLLYLTDLTDRDVVTAASKRNDRMWELGDVLEIFAGEHENPYYIEYQTAPNGLVLQILWPDASALQRTDGGTKLKAFILEDDAAVARVRRTRNGWQVYGEIPAASVQARKSSRKTLKGTVWDLSFGRYDYAADGKTFMLSSTSPLTKASNHRRHEWQQVVFVAD